MMHVIRFSGNEHLSEHLSWHLFGHLRRKRIGVSKAVCEVCKRGFVTSKLAKDCTTSRLVCFIYIW